MTTIYINKEQTLEVECNTCGLTDQLEGSYKECVTNLKKDGWKIKKEDSDFTHYCKDCQHED
jgi:hypothetical protein